MKQKIKIGTRASQLAIRQAELAGEQIERVTGWETELVTIRTKGDRILHKTLDKIGGKGLFVKEIEQALLRREIDVAVHSMKDLPEEMPKGLMLGAVLPRENPMDVLVTKEGWKWKTLPQHAKIGTGSLRRKTQLLALRPDLDIVPIRGNITTRMEKLEEGFDGVVLAAAGLLRLGMADRISGYFTTEEMVPAACQGILALQIRREEGVLKKAMEQLMDKEANICQRAERAFLDAIGADCHAPAGAFARVAGETLQLDAMFFTDHVCRVKGAAKITEPEGLGVLLAKEILEGQKVGKG